MFPNLNYCGTGVWRFPDPANVHTSLTLKMPAETLTFESVGELLAYNGLPDKVNRVSLWLHGDGKHISLRSPSYAWSRAEVSVGAESEAWCAGAVETVYAFLANHKASYHWFVALPLGWMLILLFNAFPVSILLIQKFFLPDLRIPAATGYAWIALCVSITILYVSRGALFPATTLKIRESRGFFRRNVGELGLLVAVVSAILSVISWFAGK